MPAHHRDPALPLPERVKAPPPGQPQAAAWALPAAARLIAAAPDAHVAHPAKAANPAHAALAAPARPATAAALPLPRGLASIRWRFAAAGLLLGAAGMVLREVLLAQLPDTPWAGPATLGLLALAIGAAFFAMASRLTGLIGELRRSAEAVAAGAFDAPVEVDCACEVGGLADSFRLMTARMNDNVRRINALAYTDAITGLPNRAVVDHVLAHALPPGPAGAAPAFHAALLFIDLEGLKRVNDTLGHAGGDAVLRLAARRVAEVGLQRDPRHLDVCLDQRGHPCARAPEDMLLARYSGNEFVVILPGETDRAAVMAIGERIVAALGEPFRIREQELVVGARVGIAMTPEDSREAAELLAFAGLASLQARRLGQAPVRCFDRPLRDEMLAAARTEAELRQALVRHELVLHFQPKRALAPAAAVQAPEQAPLMGVEALVRWQHPQRGLLSPAAFIDLAEQRGLMAALGREVLALALEQAVRWRDAGWPMPIAVNVSPSQFSDPGFVDSVLQALQQAGLPALLLQIEVTESMAMEDLPATLGRLGRLREAGVRVALDDFGVGYSNLSQLAQLPLDLLKIDRSLVAGIGVDDKAEAIVRAAIAMGQAMGCQVVAEGVETADQAAFLRQAGCHIGQGWLFGRPVPAAVLHPASADAGTARPSTRPPARAAQLA